MKDLLKFIFGLVCGLLSAGLILLAARQPRGQPVTLAPPPSPAPVMVQVDGAVARPGVYTLAAGSRVLDAIAAAGGLSPQAGADDLNQVTLLQDGDHIDIPEKPLSTATPIATQKNSLLQPAPSRASPTPGLPTKKINLNTATNQELESLPGIGPYLAGQIIAYRQVHGNYKTIEAVLDVPGIGAKTFELIKDLIMV